MAQLVWVSICLTKKRAKAPVRVGVLHNLLTETSLKTNGRTQKQPKVTDDFP